LAAKEVKKYNMRTKRGVLYVCASIVLAVLLSSAIYYFFIGKGRKDQFREVPLAIYPKMDVNSIRQGFDKSIGCKYVSYKVFIGFPATEVVKFYDESFDKLKLTKYSEDGCGNKGWEDFNPESGRWEPTASLPGRFMGSWVDEQKSKRVLLDLTYRYDATNPQWKEWLFVECKVCPFFDLRQIYGEKERKGM
jgi:hypothetical protein